MKTTIIKTVPHKKQRYNTWGDYYDKGNKKMILVSDFGNPDYEFLIALHEFIESYLTEKRGIKEEDITRFDVEHPELDDPGLSRQAPYHREHMLAMKIEKILAKELKVNWKKYNNSNPL